MAQVADGFFTAVFKELGIEPTENAYLLAHAWQEAEGGTAQHNPWNTTRLERGSTKYNGVGVQNYPDRATGVKATVDTLHQSNMSALLSSLRSGADPYYIAVDLARSPWGTDGWLLCQVLHDAGAGRA